MDELPIRASFMDHRGDGIKIDTTAWESPRPRKVYYRKHAIVASISDIVILRWRRLPKISLRERKGEENDGGL